MRKHVVEEYAKDLLDDGKLTEDNKSRLKRTGRTLFQVGVAAAVVVVGEEVLGGNLDAVEVGKLAVLAGVSAVVTYFHKRKS